MILGDLSCVAPHDTATNLLANVFHICRASFYYLSFYSFLSEILESWFYNQQQASTQEPETGNSSVLTFDSFCLEHNRMLSCPQIPGFPDRKRFGGGTLKNFHYDWVALTLWKSEWAVAVFTAFLLLCQAIDFSGFDTNISKCYLTLSWKIERKQRLGRTCFAPVFCVAHLPVPIDSFCKSLMKVWNIVRAMQ